MSTPAVVRVWARERAFSRRLWKAIGLAAIFQPLLYLLGVGVGVGSLIESGPGAQQLPGGVSYFAFYATALFATTSMFIASQESLWPTMDGFQWSEGYRAMISTPLTSDDVLAGLALNHVLRITVSATGVAIVLVFFEETRTIGLLGAIVGAVLTGLAFAMPLTAWTARCTTDASFSVVLRFMIIPMFLFGGAFYPIEQLPVWLRPVAWITPLWHGVELCRGSVLGGLPVGRAALHVAVLLTYALVGWFVGRRTFRARLSP